MLGLDFLDSNIGDVFLPDYQTYGPHSLAKKYNEAADGRSNVA
jgi:putative endonuclease